jgi:hypothetical protein
VPSLGRYNRALLAAAAFIAFAGAFVTTPIVARSAAGFAITRAPLVSAVPAPSAAAVVLPRRDPFTGDAPRAVAATTAVPSGAMPLVQLPQIPPVGPLPQVPPLPQMPQMPPLVRTPATLGALPPNTGAANVQFPLAAESARVTAVATGAHPFALVDEAGTTRLVTVGDRLASDTVAAITAGGVRLARGKLLTVAPTSPPITPAPGGH